MDWGMKIANLHPDVVAKWEHIDDNLDAVFLIFLSKQIDEQFSYFNMDEPCAEQNLERYQYIGPRNQGMKNYSGELF